METAVKKVLFLLSCRVAEYIPPRPVFARKTGGSKKVTPDRFIWAK